MRRKFYNKIELLESNLTIPTVTADKLNTSAIAFPATPTGMGTNSLGDYEEGSWNITLAFGGLSTGITYSTRTGYYTKVGNIVNLSGYMVLTSKGTATGAATISLPFSALANTGVSFRCKAITFATQICASTNAATFLMREVTTAGANSQITNADFANTSSMVFNLTFRV